MTFKQFEKLFKELYKTGDCWKNKEGIHYTTDVDTKRTISTKKRIFDLAHDLHLIDSQQLSNIRKKLHYRDY